MNLLRRWLGRIALMALSLTLLLFAAEGAVRLIGWGAPLKAFTRTEDQGTTTWRVPVKSDESIAVRFALHPTSFQVPKPEAVFRAFVFGGSTVYGMPFTLAAGGNDLSFVSYLRESLQRLYPRRAIEIINAGAVGMALAGVTAVFEEALEADPDLLIVLSGHNEFLPHALLGSRARQANPLSLSLGGQTGGSYLRRGFDQFMTTWMERESPDLGTRDWPTVESMVEDPHHTPADRDEIFPRAEASYRWMAQSSRAQDVPLILCTCPSNLVDFQPSSSSLEIPDSKPWIELVEKAATQIQENRLADANGILDEALALDASGAEAHFLKGRLSRSEDSSLARQHFLQALDFDGVIRRAPTTINQAIRKVAEEENVALCDVERLFSERSPQGLPGLNLFVDHVHPNLDGVVAIAQSLFSEVTGMAEKGQLQLPWPPDGTHSDAADRDDVLKTLGYNPKLELQVDKQIGLSYANLILLRRYDPEARYRVAVQHLEKVRDTIPESLRNDFPLYSLASTYLGGIHVISGHPESATACFDEAKKYDANWAQPLREFLHASSVLRKIFEESGLSIPD